MRGVWSGEFIRKMNHRNRDEDVDHLLLEIRHRVGVYGSKYGV